MRCPDVVPSPTTDDRWRRCVLQDHHANEHYWLGLVVRKNGGGKFLELHRWDEDGRTTSLEQP